MRVRCLTSKGFLFTMREVRDGLTNVTTYDGVHVNRDYAVYGLSLFKGDLSYLIYDNFDMPNWYPATLFELIDHRMPPSWSFNFFGYQEYETSARWGYSELVSSIKHANGLAEQESADIELFLLRKEEIDRWESCIGDNSG